MAETINLAVEPEIGLNQENLDAYLKIKYPELSGETHFYKVRKRSIDARFKNTKVNLQIVISKNSEFIKEETWSLNQLKNVRNCPEIIIVGSGPAGLFAALSCIENGLKPIVLERGKDVQARRIDLANINKKHIVNPDSNYCFGEGGAGTYSDGKLYTRSGKRGSVDEILQILIAHGAKEDIRVDARPHIGTNKLPKIIAQIRQSIVENGGEFRFDSRVTDFIISDSSIKGVKIGNETIEAKGVILATGHSARDIFELFRAKKIKIESKPFALGVRVEHPQEIIDSIQYSCDTKNPILPAANYSLVNQSFVNGEQKGVFSFCMCPGGFIVPSATNQEEVVVNGMSPSKRDSKYANSGIVIEINESDFGGLRKKYGDLAAMQFQKNIERNAWIQGGKTQTAPAQRLVDFIDKKVSTSLPDSSYIPGLSSTSMYEVLPNYLAEFLKKGFIGFGQKMKRYLTNEAVIVGVESRSSSPLRIPRDKETFEHVEIKRLYPCGEGAGYAGGIISAAIDGRNCVKKLCENYFTKS